MADELHSVPCKLKYTGPAKISNYFNCTREIQNDQTLTASFRGKHLIGANVKLPDGYGLHIAEKATTEKLGELNNDEQMLNNLGNVKNLFYWNYDNSPSNKDPIAKATVWAKIADKLFNSDA